MPSRLKYNDRYHTYTLDGVRCKSISKVAEIPSDTFQLEQWRKRTLLTGVALRPELAERAAAHFDDRVHLEQIAEEALAAGQAHDAAARGTAAHRITERIDLGELIIDTPQARAVQKAWARALQIAGLEIIPELVERIVLYPEHRIAGRTDRFAGRKADGRLVVADLKTGANAVKYPHTTAVQMALYANAPLMAGPVPRDGGTTEEFTRLPDVDRTVGYVIHMPSDGEVDVVAVDLEAGWKAAQLCFDILAWRKRRDLLIPVTEIKLDSPDRTAWIRSRLAQIGRCGGKARRMAAEFWPEGVPPRPPWTDQHIDRLDIFLQGVETYCEAPFEPADPSIHKQPTMKGIPPP